MKNEGNKKMPIYKDTKSFITLSLHLRFFQDNVKMLFSLPDAFTTNKQ